MRDSRDEFGGTVTQLAASMAEDDGKRDFLVNLAYRSPRLIHARNADDAIRIFVDLEKIRNPGAHILVHECMGGRRVR